SEFQNRRGGVAALTATITSSATSVGQVLTQTTPGSPVTVQIQPGSSQSPSGLASGGVVFDPIAAGTTVVSAAIPGLTATTAASVTVNVSSSGISLSATTVGAGLQRNVSGNLGASGHGGVSVTLTSSDPTKVLLQKDAATPATSSISIPVANGATGFSYY